MKQLSLLEAARISNPELPDAEHIGQIAAETIADLGEEPPISLEVVASYCGIFPITVQPLPVAGMLAPEDGRMVMHLRAADSPRRRRFTGFHEVGHSFQPGFRQRRHFRCATPRLRSDAGTDPEALADHAAAELLLPARFFEADIHASDFGLDDVCELADHYDASVQATAYRYLRFWPEAMLLLVLEPGLRKSERLDPDAQPRLRVRSVHTTGDWPYIPMNKSAADEGALVRALEGEIVKENIDLSEFGVGFDQTLEISARSFNFIDADGVAHQRVMALYRAPRSPRSVPEPSRRG